jgi:diadenosine tetraphosphate (Ap4A) HIT family hydrolase
VHIHVLPRRPGDFEKNDDVYNAIEDASKEAARCAALWAVYVLLQSR